MDRWTGILKIPVSPNGSTFCRIGASLCISSSKSLTVPTANAIFFNGDRVEGTGNPVIDRLSNLQYIAEILVSKFGASTNAWVIEASKFNGPFAVYQEFFKSLNQWGEPQSYNPDGFPASTSVATLLSNFLEERAKKIDHIESHHSADHASFYPNPKTIVLGFSKGGVVLNQLITELSFSDNKCTVHPPGNQIVPLSRECFIDSITDIHFVDVGLNSSGAYLTDDDVIGKIAQRLIESGNSLRFVLHGTPRQWSDKRRPWIHEEKDRFYELLEYARQKSYGKVEVSERTYFAESFPNLQMHFEIIESLDVS